MPDHRDRRRSATAVMVMVVLLLGLAAVFGRVLKLRFSSGEIYPHYSSLRSDPLGTRALYEALDTLEGVEVSRSLRPLARIDGLDADSTILLLGIPRASLAWLFVRDDDPLLEAVREGARFVIAVNPGLVPRTGDQAEEDWWQRQRRIRGGGSGRESTSTQEATLLTVLGAEVVVPEIFERPEGGWELAPAESAAKEGAHAPSALPDWYSQCRLSDLSPAWSVVAEVAGDGGAVVAERRFGEGSVVLASGAHFASNEALWESASSEFLAWLVSDRPRVVFDESIHGARQSTGVMQLVRRYRLHGILFGLLAVMALVAWRSGSSLVPKQISLDRGVGADGAVVGEAAASGLVGLLRRSVSPASLLRRCADLWRESTRSSDATADREIERVIESAPNAVDGYRDIVAALDRKRR